jgi:RNA polymerase sigma factor (TIGR02999 family)
MMPDASGTPSQRDVSQLLCAFNDGDRSALDQLIPLLYRELRAIARRRLRREDSTASLQSADLVNEAYLRLVQQRQPGWQHRSQFFAVAATIMRRILIDRARRNLYQKRGAGAVPLSLDDQEIGGPVRAQDLVALDEAMQMLERRDRRKAAVVELKYFGGMTTDEVARHLGVSTITVKRDWAFARSWLHRAMSHGQTGERDVPR